MNEKMINVVEAMSPEAVRRVSGQELNPFRKMEVRTLGNFKREKLGSMVESNSREPAREGVLE